MTDEEFLISLPQDLPRDEKIRRLEEWRKENPQPKKEEQPEEVEDKSDLPIGAAGPAGEPPKKEEELEFSFQKKREKAF